jgi:gamma-glutamyl hercynylcysteine S-oxide synthase
VEVPVSVAVSVPGAQLASWYARSRERSRALFDLVEPDAYYTRPITLRNPIVFYEGHLPAFSVIAFLQRGLGRRGVDERLEALFERGIDPEREESAIPRSGADTRWPAREEVLAYGADVDRAIGDVLARWEQAGLDDTRAREGVFTALEHEAMHQETLLYMWRRLPYRHKRKPAGVSYERGSEPPPPAVVHVPAGEATLGARPGDIVFGWDNEFGERVDQVPGFEIDVHSVTNADFLAFIADGGYDRQELWTENDWAWLVREHVTHPAFWIDRGGQWAWRGMFEELPLPPAWPVYVSHAEASAYARWKGRRLPTEAEYHRAAFGTPEGRERPLPWSDEAVVPATGEPGNFDLRHWEPVPAGSRPLGASAWGVHDLMGNGWEWTASVFEPFPGFTPMLTYPEYSADFFDGQHYVLKGASPGTARELVRRSFRNWFRPHYPYVYAKFRTVSAGER